MSTTTSITPISRTDTANYTEVDIYKELEYLKELFTRLRICDAFNISFFVKIVNRKPIEASQEELAVNQRSRSAKLRICEKI